MIFSDARNGESPAGTTTSFPPESPFPKPSFASPVSRMVSPFGIKAPKDCPPPPSAFTTKVSSARLLPNTLVMSDPRMVPKDRSVLDTLSDTVIFSAFEAALFFSTSVRSAGPFPVPAYVVTARGSALGTSICAFFRVSVKAGSRTASSFVFSRWKS